MFQIKDFSSISASMMNYAKAVQNRITDFSVGSIVRTMFESPAVEIEELYQQMFIGLREAIPVAIYNSFDFTRLPAIPATGIIRVTVTSSGSSIFIPAGTIFRSTSLTTTFISLYDYTIIPGVIYKDVVVSAQTPGVIGNIDAGVSFSTTPTITKFVSALSISEFNSGRDKESDQNRKSRFAEYILTLNHGTVAAIKYALKLANLKDVTGNITESIKFFTVVEPYVLDHNQPIALVNCYIHNGVNGASVNLINRADEIMLGYTDENGNIIPGWKAAGVRVDIYAATNITQPIVCTLNLLTGYEPVATKLLVRDAISDYLSALNIGDDILRAEIISEAMSIQGVANIVLTTPATDIAISSTQKAMIGSFTA